MTPKDVLAHASALLLDFDGPVCSVFAGVPAATVADQLRDILADGGHVNLPENIATSADPFDIFRYAASLGEEEARHVEAAFTAHEVEAICTSNPTDGAHDLIEAWHTSGRPLAIVSNNSAAAITAYLDLYDLHASVDCISARTSPDASLLKPNPYLLNQAAVTLATSPDECAFIGDSVSDIEAARAAGVRSIGYANKPGKTIQMINARADTILTHLKEFT